MTEAQTYAWIFYATSAAASQGAVKPREIEAVADGINHAVPTQKEMAVSIAWAESKSLLEREGARVRLTEDGRQLATRLKEPQGSVMKIWERFTIAFQKLGADNVTDLDCRTMQPKK